MGFVSKRGTDPKNCDVYEWLWLVPSWWWWWWWWWWYDVVTWYHLWDRKLVAHDHAYASWMVPLSCVDARLDTKPELWVQMWCTDDTDSSSLLDAGFRIRLGASWRRKAIRQMALVKLWLWCRSHSWKRPQWGEDGDVRDVTRGWN